MIEIMPEGMTHWDLSGSNFYIERDLRKKIGFNTLKEVDEFLLEDPVETAKKHPRKKQISYRVYRRTKRKPEWIYEKWIGAKRKRHEYATIIKVKLKRENKEQFEPLGTTITKLLFINNL